VANKYIVRTELCEIDGEEETSISATETEEMSYDDAAELFEEMSGVDPDTCCVDEEEADEEAVG
jgi:hypothetical protein